MGFVNNPDEVGTNTMLEDIYGCIANGERGIAVDVDKIDQVDGTQIGLRRQQFHDKSLMRET